MKQEWKEQLNIIDILIDSYYLKSAAIKLRELAAELDEQFLKDTQLKETLPDLGVTERKVFKDD